MSSFLYSLTIFIGVISAAVSENGNSVQYSQDNYLSQPTQSNSAPLPRDTYTAPGYESVPPLTYSSASAAPSGTFYASDFATASNANNGLGFGANVGIGFPNIQNYLSTGLTVVVGLFLVSLIIQIFTKIMASSFFERIFDGLVDADARLLDESTMNTLTNLAVDAILKLKEEYEQ